MIDRVKMKKISRSLPHGEETILLVEDDPMVRRTLFRMLTRLGYRALCAENGEEACRLANSCRKNIDLLITDLVMPGMNGRTLAKKAAEAQPGIKVLFTSGYASDIVAQQGIHGEAVNYIGKPYSLDDIARKVREVLDAPGTERKR